ncbi:hypothetical protein BUALT_Bualt13G0075000 [Buddleja alternifolia]|uniref:GATA-type domain-containing protein n=1 Tax=Buddleja alternifolia TaxID=168488 RepID=A0AAV6WL90_9LAMI|nr:hypothetical protein BUALT_Bualt13G0075000 [Buddleja alternifolia]
MYVLNMGKVEPSCYWDDVASGATGDEKFDDILGILDFPLESLEDDEFVEEWDASKSSSLGPIPSDVLMGLPAVPKIDSCPRPQRISQHRSQPSTTASLPPLLCPLGNTTFQPWPPVLRLCPSGTVALSSCHNSPATMVSDVWCREEVLHSWHHCYAPLTSSLWRHHSTFLISGTPEPKQLSSQFKDRSVQEPNVFQIQSPISVLESRGSHSARKSLLTKSHFAIPVGTRSKRVRPSADPWFSRSSFFATSKMAYDSKKNKERRMELSMKDSSRKAKSVFGESDSVFELQNASATKKCTHCQVTKTPQWREGPLGPKTLCNACGVRHRSGRLFPEYRPAASPTFVPSLHSNSHRKVIEMRNKCKQKASEVEVPVMSPDMEFIPMSSYLFDSV